MILYKRNQVEEAIFATLGAHDARVEELRFRIKRLLVTDRRSGRDKKSKDEDERNYAFYSDEPSGSGTEVLFSAYEAFAILAAVVLLEHGWPQASVIRVLRQVRRSFELAHARTLKRDPKRLFDEKAVLTQAEAGMFASDNTHPVFLVIVRLRDSSVDRKATAASAVCEGHPSLFSFVKKHREPGLGTSFFEFVRLLHTFATNLSKTRPAKRGRGAK